jgi:sirohydrochlorin ferrochelatase
MLKTITLALAASAAPLAAQQAHDHAVRKAPPQPTAASAGQSAAARRAGAVGTILIAHGGTPEWNQQVLDIARQARTGGPVAVSFLMGPAAKDHRFQDVAARLERDGVGAIVAVPLLVSSHSGHYQQIRYIVGETDSLEEGMRHHLHMAGIDRARLTVPVRLARAIDDSPEVARVLAERARAIAPDPRGRALFIVGHGPNSAEDYAGWMENLRPVADTVRALTGFRDVRLGLVRDDAPKAVRDEAVRQVRETIELQYALTGQKVVVVPVLVSRGPVSQKKIPADLAGLPVEYTGETLLPHPGLARWIEARVRESSASIAAKE